ncbi:FtsX-like permease family protein [Planktothrix agardhii]|jgi:putative ABC transport system permease protein|uniref:Macrolide export ATP-binding/permease protein macB n=2 Tax=Planktothrix agardhii TaxID=1160 RepID=A0A073CEZ3_PLAA1|nr:FtsX-like permease family protein [Planktothrix agardhii]MCF3607582.1 FtsX-like permease family protein [Planktothrix agardhii 1033]KEI66487.1 Macrolide export ATP-binding/permease protein macB [Planktothrix agardhii NIVA-CYA 126/8]MBG0747562.1 FtsX-like permease family protein [Planktothrix agardhii KL2]MCB8751701.1 FtsX-like permease family protein [Planktothrix agardhii 1810]MCB8760683.1 FtsX-like permease family protein [Planktothrix agardhii 1813]
MASLARKNLFEDIPRFLVAQAGIMFAVSLVTIQNGILTGFIRSSSILIDHSKADFWIASKDMIHLELTMPISLERMTQSQTVEGVERAEAFIFRNARWRDPLENKIHAVTVVGSDPDGKLFSPWNIIQGDANTLKNPYTIMVDESKLNALKIKNIGDIAKLGGLEAKLGGITQGTQSIVSNSFIFTSLKNANAYVNSPVKTQTLCQLQNDDLQCTQSYEDQSSTQKPVNSPPPRPLNLADPITYVLIKAKPDQDLTQLKQKLKQTLPNDVQVLSREEMSMVMRTFWQKRTGVGFVLSLGAAIGVLVGMVVVGQILYSSVSDHLKEFGTLKAMGASDWVIYGIILEQALWMAVLGYIPGMALCFGVAYWAGATQGILILITPLSALGVFGLTVVMCTGSAFFAIQKVTKVDPAIVFKA